jgi:AbrB family looped-hinge helix DNA binding protein
MKTVTVSPKFQVVIPREVREALKVEAGQKMRVVAYDRHVVFVPVRSIKEARGNLKGMDTDVQREKEDRAL